MRRDKLAVELTNSKWPESGAPKPPRFVIRFDGPEAEFANRFRNPDGFSYPPDQLDFFLREQPSETPSTSTGVFCVSDRMTGDFLFEINASTEFIAEFSDAIRRYDEATEESPRYEVALWAMGTERAVFTKQTFLVYRQDGTLLRHRSVIPTSVEL